MVYFSQLSKKFQIYLYFTLSSLRLVKGLHFWKISNYSISKIFPFTAPWKFHILPRLIPGIWVCILRTLPEKTLRTMRAGTGNGSGRNTGKRSKNEPVRETGLDNSRCHAGKDPLFRYVWSCLHPETSLYVLLSAGSANKTQEVCVWEDREIKELKRQNHSSF